MINLEMLNGDTYVSFLALTKLVDKLELSKLDVTEVKTSYKDKTATFLFENSVELYVAFEILDDTILTRYYTTDTNFLKSGKFLDETEDLYFYNSDFKLSSILYIHYYLMVNNVSDIVITKIINNYCHFTSNNIFFMIDMDKSEIIVDSDEVFENTLVTFKPENYKEIELNTYRYLEDKQLYISMTQDYENYNKKDFLLEYNIFADDVLNYFNGSKNFRWVCKGFYLDNSHYVFTIDFIRLSDNVKARIVINQVKIDKIDYRIQYSLDSDFKFNIIDINIYSFDNFKYKEIVNIYTDKYEVDWYNQNNYTATFKDSQNNYFDYTDILDLIKQNIFNFCF